MRFPALRRVAPVMLACAFLAACDTTPEEELPDPAVQVRATTSTYSCSQGRSFTVTFSDDEEASEATLVLDDLNILMEREKSATGVRYTLDDYTFWTNGETAMFEGTGGLALTACARISVSGGEAIVPIAPVAPVETAPATGGEAPASPPAPAPAPSPAPATP
ncbi:MAG: MliC family protein [Alphaproteobacteria bacterium]|nr:MliC family protein [Alphaproteobacteria bacterium]